jgi:hypothetical protein
MSRLPLLLILPVVAACSDTTAPSWPGGAALEAEPGADAIRVTWPTPLDDDVLVYVVSVDGEERTRTTVSTHTVTISDLEDETSYAVAVVALDDEGNASAPLTIAVTTLDGTPPEWPEGAELTATSPSPASAEERVVDLAWPAALDGVRYRVFRDDTEAGFVEVLVLSLEPASLIAATTFEVRALDQAGNESEGLTVTWGETAQAGREAEAPVATTRARREGPADDARLLGLLSVLSDDGGGSISNALSARAITPIDGALISTDNGDGED